MGEPTGRPFVLKSSSDDFRQRQKSVFDQLNSLPTTLRSPQDNEMDVDINSSHRSHRRNMRQFRGKESIFKRPQEVKHYLRNMPDFKKNPHKWQKYSLGDVRDEDMSERSNTKAALSFLQDLKKRRSLEDEQMDDEEPQKIVFRKTINPDVVKRKCDDQDNKPSFRSSKRVMPEYVVGQKAPKGKKEKNLKAECGKRGQLKLDHLCEDEDD